MTLAPVAPVAPAVEDTRRRRPVWVPIAAAGLGGAVLLATGYGVFASLDATANNTTPQTVTSGVLSLTLADNGAGFSQAVNKVAPGDTINRFVNLTNNGSLAAKNLTLKLAATGSTTLITDGVSPSTTKALTVAVDSCTVAWTPGTNACGGTTANILAAAPASTLTGAAANIAVPQRAAGAVNYLRISLALPDQNETIANGATPAPNAPGTIQNQTANLTWTFRQEQRTAAIDNA